MVHCTRCGIEVNPMRVLGSRKDPYEKGVSVQTGGFYSQCPECASVLPPDPAETTESSGSIAPDQVNEVTFLPMVPMGAVARQQPQASPTPARPASMIDSARAELAACDAELAALSAQIESCKTEIRLKKAHRKGIFNMVLAYERAALPSAPRASRQLVAVSENRPSAAFIGTGEL